MDFSNSKRFNKDKFDKRKQAKRTQKDKRSRKIKADYENTVKDLKNARQSPSSKDVDRLVKKLEGIKKSKKKYRKFGAKAQALSPKIAGYGNSLLDGLHQCIENAKTIREVIGEDVLSFLLDVFTTLYNIYKTPEWDSVLVNVSSLFLRNFPKEYAEYALVWFRSAFDIAMSQSSEKSSYKDLILNMFSNTNEFIQDALWTNIVEFFVKISALYAAVSDAVSFEALDMDTLLKQFRLFKENMPKCQDLVESAFAAYEFVLGSWEEIRTGKWGCFLLGKDETQVFELEVRTLEQAFPLVIANQKDELMTIYNLTPEKYETRLTAAIKTAKSLISRCSSATQRMSVSTFIKTLTDRQAELYARIADAPRRDEPYSIKLSGPSSCGKSTLVPLISKIMLHAYGLDPSEKGQVVFTNISERYESTIKPSHKIIVADDIANNLNEKPNYDRILNYVNTVPRPLEKADVKEKGILYPGNVAFIGTTNDETLRAEKCSTKPESIWRRFVLDVSVGIREEFRNAYGGIIDMDSPRLDIYELVLKRFESYDEVNNTIKWDIIPRSEWNEYDDNEHDLAALIKFVGFDINKHIKRVKEKAAAQEELDACNFCSTCSTLSMFCSCPQEEGAEIQFGSFWSTFSTAELWDIRASLSGSRDSCTNLYKNVLFCKKIWQRKRKLYKYAMMMFGAMMIGSLFGSKYALPIFVYGAGQCAFNYVQMINEVDREIAERSDKLSCLCIGAREHLQNNMKKYFATGAAAIMLYKTYVMIRPLITQDKSTYLDLTLPVFDKILESPPKGDFVYKCQDERDYKEGYSRLTPKESNFSKTTTSKDLQIAISKALRVVVVKSKGEFFATVNGIMVESNVIMVPSHSIPFTFPFSIETTTTPNVPSAKTKDQNLTENFVEIDREFDVAFVHLASSPASTNFARFFPEEPAKFLARSTVMLWKSPDNEVKISRQAARPITEELTYSGALEHPGLLYGTRMKHTTFTMKPGNGMKVDLEFPSFAGLCGGLYIDAVSGIIYGFHVAGIPYTNRGFFTCITRPQITKAIDALRKRSPTMIVHSSVAPKVDSYGMPYTLINEKPLYTREDGTGKDTVVTYLGKVLVDGQPMESRARSPYLPTPFEGVVEEFGESKHRPPTRINDVEKTMATLNKLTTPVQHYEGDVLEKAINDYKDHTLAIIEDNMEECQEMLRVYTQEEAMDGIGKFGLSGIPNDTSAGFPICKSKKHCLVRDLMDESLVKIPREFNGRFDIQSEIDRTEECWRNNTRSEVIFKASSKANELLPNKKAKAKVRKFYGGSFANLVASRKYLAGIPQFMRKFWKRTECLVGINPTSLEWGDVYDHLTEYSSTNMIAGDFSGFDTRMAAQITGAASQIMLAWYEKAGCTEDELTMIAGALSDIIHPNILIDGDLYRFANGNPSGNLITVQLNSICNSIMMRYVYYAQKPSCNVPLADNARVIVYGDDNAIAVKDRCYWYTHTSCQEEFAKLDIGYTMADKEAESVPYISIDDISFLKRKFVKHETLNKIVAPIEEDSILKKFFYIKKPNESPLSPEEQFGAYTDGAYREAYLHGKTYFETFVDHIKNIVVKNPILSTSVYYPTYDEMTLTLEPDYQPGYVNDNKKLFAESCGVPDSDA